MAKQASPWLAAPDDVPDPPPEVVGMGEELRADLDQLLGAGLVSLYLYGAMAFPRPDDWHLDFDFHALIARPLADSDGARIQDLQRRLGDRW